MKKIYLLPFNRLTTREQRALLVSTLIAAVLVELLIVFQTLQTDPETYRRSFALFFGSVGIPYTILLYYRIYPVAERITSLRWIVVLLNGVGLAYCSSVISGISEPLFHSLTILAIPATVIIFGRWPAYVYALSATLGGFIILLASDHLAWHTIGHLAGLPFLAFAIIETVHCLGGAIEEQMRRLDTLNRVSSKIISTLEINKVVALVREAVQEALQADSYYVALLKGETLHLELFYDDGEFFTGLELPARGGLAGWVIENRRPLLLRYIPKEIEALGVELRIVGQPKTSLSWMGVPMIASNHLIGVMAVASYQPNVFSEADLDMLINLSNQASLVIDNAFHHADVERQSRLDSLTQIYNHGSFLSLLQEHAQRATERGAPLSLIMLDVDHFKKYNDTFGHLAGDQALTAVVQAIHANVRSTDIVGRWGGEEFIIMLPEATGRQAVQVAQRIRQTLHTIEITTDRERRFPAPTISQGVAMLSEAASGEKLIELADRRLYHAKHRGRDQVEPVESWWESQDAEVNVPVD